MRNTFKKAVSILLGCFVMLSLQFSAAAGWNSQTFSDLDADSWYLRYVQFGKENSIFLGTSPTLFAPNRDMSRCQAVTILGRIHEKITGEKIPKETKSSFCDVPSGRYYSSYVGWAEKTGLLDINPSAAFAPHRAINREELAVLLYRYVSVMEINKKRELEPQGYCDLTQATPSARAALREMEKYRLFHTTTAGNYFENDVDFPGIPLHSTVTRGEGAAILIRFYQRLSYPLDEETPRNKYSLKSPLLDSEEHTWPIHSGESIICRSRAEYDNCIAQLSPWMELLNEGPALAVDETTFENHRIAAISIPVFDYESPYGEISCAVTENTAIVTFVSNQKICYKPDEFYGYLYFVELPQNISKIEIREYRWISDKLPTPAF